MAKDILIRFLQDRPVAYHADIAKATGSVTAGLFLSQLLYWSDKGSDPDGWIYKTQLDWYNETGLTRREQETARKKLKQLKVLQEERRGLPARLYYKIDFDRLIELLKSFYDDDDKNPATPVKPGMAESDKQERTGAPNWNGGKRHTGKAESDIHTITENTTENTNKEEEEEKAKSENRKITAEEKQQIAETYISLIGNKFDEQMASEDMLWWLEQYAKKFGTYPVLYAIARLKEISEQEDVDTALGLVYTIALNSLEFPPRVSSKKTKAKGKQQPPKTNYTEKVYDSTLMGG